MDTHRHLAENIFGDYCDGKRCREHPLFSTDPVALQIILYYDELELCNPLGSRRKKHKIGNIDSHRCINVIYLCIVYVLYYFSDTLLSFYIIFIHALMHTYIYVLGAFYFMLGNLSPRFRSKISNIQLLLLAKYSLVAEFGIDRLLQPIVEDIRKLESVNICESVTQKKCNILICTYM